MLFGLVLLLHSRAVADGYRFELKHIYNSECEKIVKDNTQPLVIAKDSWTKSTYKNYLRECKNIEHVDFEDTSIPDYAFYASSIQRIDISSDTATIGKGAFAYCKNLSIVNFPRTSNAEVKILEGAFYHSGVNEITNFPDVETIPKYAFEGCPLSGDKGLEFTYSKLKIIEERAFYGSNLTKISLCNSMTTIGERAFQHCKNLKFNEGSNIEANTIGPFAFANCPKVSNIVVKSTNIGESAFQCDKYSNLKISKIEQIKDGDEVKALEIGRYAFYGRTVSLKDIEKYKGLTINEFAFAFCTFEHEGSNFYGIQIDNGADPITIGNHAFYNSKLGSSDTNIFKLVIGTCGKNSFIGYHAFESSQGPLNLTYTDDAGVIEIRDYAFYRSGIYNSPPIKEEEDKFIKIVDHFNLIGTRAFAECQLISDAVYIKGVSVGKYAFYNCKNLKKIVIYNADLIGEGAFEKCTGDITNLTIKCNRILNEGDETSKTVEIGDRAFYGSGLNCDLVLHSFITSIGEYAFAYCKNLPRNSLTIYSYRIRPFAFACCGGTFTRPISIHSSIIEYHCFDENELTDITIGRLNDNYDNYVSDTDDDITTSNIKTEAFYDITFHGLVNIQENAKIEYNAFQHCKFYENIEINGTIDPYAFDDCTMNKDNKVLSIGATSVGNHAFQRFGQVSKFTLKFHDIQLGENTIGAYAFFEANITGDVEIPWCFCDIGEYAFTNCIDIKSLVVNNSNIGQHAFEGCQNLQKLELYSHGEFTNADGTTYSGMQTIDSYAFYSLQLLASDLIIPREVININDYAFANCKLIPKLIIEQDSKLSKFSEGVFANCSSMSGQINVTKTIKSIDNYAFYGCKNLNQLIFFKADTEITSIGEQAFYDCDQLDGVLDIPESVTKIGREAFYNCKGFTHHMTINSECTIEDRAFYGCNQIKRVELNFPAESDNNIYIGDYAFTGLPVYNNYHYDKENDQDEEEDDILNIPEYIYRIGEGAFENCTGLRNLIINIKDSYEDGLDRIGAMARSFYGSSVRSISIKGSNDKYYIGDYAFSNCQKLVSGISIEGGTFGDYVFANCINIGPDSDNVAFEMSGGSIGRYSFEGCTNFNGLVKLSGSVEIKESAFEDFNSPFTLVVDDSKSEVKVRRRAFYHCVLTGPLDIRGIKEIGNEAFANCPNTLDSLTIHADAKTGKDIFKNTRFGNNTVPDGIVQLTVFIGSIFKQSLLHDCNYFNKLVLESGDDEYDIPYKAFYEMSNLQGELTIPESVSNIGEYAFAGCGFYQIIFEGSDTQIKEGAFYNCKNLNDTIDLSEIQTIPKRAFCGCSNLQSIILSELTVFERGAFEGCSSLNFDIRLPDSYPDPTPPDPPEPEPQTYTIPKYAFSGCSSLEGTHGSLLIPSYVSEIGDYAFQGCAFKHLEFAKRTESKQDEGLILGIGAFSGCRHLSFELELPKLKDNKIPDRAFSGCSGLTSIEYPETITTIGKYAFNGCSGIRGPLEIPFSIKRIEEYAFAGCSGYSGSLTINVEPDDDEHTIIGPHAFDGCTGFKNGDLHIFVEKDEESFRAYGNTGSNQNQFPYFRYRYFLRIGPKAFEDTKFKNVYYNGRFQPDCDYDIGFSHTKGIHTSSNYLNKTFCSYPLHKNKLSGGAIAGITIAVIIVVAVIVLLVIFFILRNKKSKDISEDEVELNADP